MATYTHRFIPATGTDPDISLFHVVERPLYGSSRLGVDAQEVDLGPASPTAPTTAHPGQWRYELTDHLGNVQAVVTEELLGLDATNDQSVDQWAPVLVSAQDYEPFGSLLPGRNFSSDSYRFGFQGQEKDDEIQGATGTSYNYKYRMHDPRVGRFLSIDPLAAKYAYNSPYAFSENRVIDSGELEGLERYFAVDGNEIGRVGHSQEIRLVTSTELLPVARTQELIKEANDCPQSGCGDWLLQNSMQTFGSPDRAAEHFGLRYGSASIVEDVEYGSRIGSVDICLDGQTCSVFALGTLTRGAGSVDPDRSNLLGMKPQGFVHTHGSDPRVPGAHSNFFSGGGQWDDFLGEPGDIDWAQSAKLPIYLSGPDGALRRYSPSYPYSYKKGLEAGTLLSKKMPFDPACRQQVDYENKTRPAYNPDIMYNGDTPSSKDAIRYDK